MAYLTQFTSSSVPVIKFLIDQNSMTIGQNIEMDICVAEEGIAEKHAVLEAIEQAEKHQFLITSHENEELIELNGLAVSHAELKDGDWLIIGDVEFQFTDDGINEIVKTPTPKVKVAKIKPGKTVNTLNEKIVKPLSTKEFIEDSRFSRRLNRF